jgi:hypothetical protein
MEVLEASLRALPPVPRQIRNDYFSLPREFPPRARQKDVAGKGGSWKPAAFVVDLDEDTISAATNA